jgi:hypothetical protein
MTSTEIIFVITGFRFGGLQWSYVKRSMLEWLRDAVAAVAEGTPSGPPAVVGVMEAAR